MRKKLLLIPLVLTFLAISLGCSSGNTPSPSPSPDPGPTPDPNNPTAPVFGKTSIYLEAGQRITDIDWVDTLSVTAQDTSKDNIEVKYTLGNTTNIEFVASTGNTSTVTFTATNKITNKSNTKTITINLVNTTKSDPQKETIYNNSIFRFDIYEDSSLKTTSSGMFLDYDASLNELLVLVPSSDIQTNSTGKFVVIANSGKSSSIPTLCAEKLYDAKNHAEIKANLAIMKIVGTTSNNCVSNTPVNISNYLNNISLLNHLKILSESGDFNYYRYLNNIPNSTGSDEKYFYKLYTSLDTLTPYNNIYLGSRYPAYNTNNYASLANILFPSGYDFTGILFNNDVTGTAGATTGITPVVDQNLNVIGYNSIILSLSINSGTINKKHVSVHHSDAWQIYKAFCSSNTKYSNMYICKR